MEVILCPHAGKAGVSQFPPLGIFDKAADDVSQWLGQELENDKNKYDWVGLASVGYEKKLYYKQAKMVKSRV